MPNYFENPIAGYGQYRGTMRGASEEHGIYSFTTTGTTVEVPTHLSEVLAAFITPTEAFVVGTLPFCDLTITDGAVTITRDAGTTSGLTFSYIFIGLT